MTMAAVSAHISPPISVLTTKVLSERKFQVKRVLKVRILFLLCKRKYGFFEFQCYYVNALTQTHAHALRCCSFNNCFLTSVYRWFCWLEMSGYKLKRGLSKICERYSSLPKHRSVKIVRRDDGDAGTSTWARRGDREGRKAALRLAFLRRFALLT